ncbi:hypothetical protein [Methylobacter sp.]|uniref:hypothetical protein n=2 Tax=Methylobacter sp. TaxID=2051955 RepID=UPI002610424D|nr:hypothetical protein [Methylobacter sp.]
MPPTADMVMEVTAIMDLGHASTAEAGEGMVGGAMNGAAAVGEDVVGIEAGFIRQTHPVRTTAMLSRLQLSLVHFGK